MSVAGRRVIASTPVALRRGARILLEHGARAGIIAFRLADTHLHATLLCMRDEAGAYAHRVECALGWGLRPGAPFEAAHFEPIYEQRHLTRALWYDLRQEEHHGTALDPMHEGSSLYDTLGLRIVDPAFSCRVARALPRTCRSELAQLLAPNALELIDHVGSGPLLLECLADAAAAALALPSLATGHGAVHTMARRGAIEVALAHAHRWSRVGLHARVRAVARAIGLSRGGTYRLANRAPHPTSNALELHRAVLLQWQLRSGLAECGLWPVPPLLPEGGRES
jgi:hypothetical protein